MNAQSSLPSPATPTLADPPLSVPLANTALPLLASSRLTLSPLGTPPETVTLKLTAWPASEARADAHGKLPQLLSRRRVPDEKLTAHVG